MKKVFAFLVIFLIGVGSFFAYKQFANDTKYINSKVKVEHGNKKNVDKTIKWLNFSMTDFEKERRIVAGHFKKEITEISEGKYGSNTMVDIAIALEDINGDNEKEIIAILFHSYFSGANTNGSMGIFVEKNGVKKYIPLPQVFVDSEKIKSQKEIGVRKSVESRWDEFLVNKNIWKWSKDRYIFAEKIN